MKVEQIKDFVSLLDKKDGILLGVQPDVEDDSKDDTISEFESDLETEMEVDSTDVDDDEYSVQEGVDDGEDIDCCDESNPSDVVADAMAEVIVEGHHSVDFMEGGHIYTSNKTAQICVSSLSGQSDYETETDVEEEDE